MKASRYRVERDDNKPTGGCWHQFFTISRRARPDVSVEYDNPHWTCHACRAHDCDHVQAAQLYTRIHGF